MLQPEVVMGAKTARQPEILICWLRHTGLGNLAISSPVDRLKHSGLGNLATWQPAILIDGIRRPGLDKLATSNPDWQA